MPHMSHVYPYIITVSSEKGGVGKTTLATNLAIFLKALSEDLPVTVFSLDNHFTVDKMFEIKGQKPKGTVADILMEVPGHQLLHTGQYGVNYIPSSADLPELRHAVTGPMVLSRLLATSQIPGILIIDTRPDLDILTQNALYAADRVIIPVKDMASMENCRNIFALFDTRGMDRSSLCIIPCLVDERIKFDGPFKDQKSLIRAFTLNRGYRSFDTIISKSPKVESLNTNPDGRVYPILTHARGTEVYGQFYRLASQILDEISATKERRAALFHQWLTSEDQRKKDAFYARMSGVKGECLVCRAPIAPSSSAGAAFYCETADSTVRGFVEEQCFLNLLRSDIYQLPATLPTDDPTWLLLKDAARQSSFIFRPLANGGGNLVEFSRFDKSGSHLLSKQYRYPVATAGTKLPLQSLLGETLIGDDAALGAGYLLVHPVSAEEPQRILREDAYRVFSKLKRRLGELLQTPPPLN
jgi:cellulose biosynthesis protein BcsQ